MCRRLRFSPLKRRVMLGVIIVPRLSRFVRVRSVPGLTFRVIVMMRLTVLTVLILFRGLIKPPWRFRFFLFLVYFLPSCFSNRSRRTGLFKFRLLFMDRDCLCFVILIIVAVMVVILLSGIVIIIRGLRGVGRPVFPRRFTGRLIMIQ